MFSRRQRVKIRASLTDIDWLTQHARLLADFGDSYIAPWAEELVATGELRRSPGAAGRRWLRKNLKINRSGTQHQAAVLGASRKRGSDTG